MEAIPNDRRNPEPREAKPYGWALSSWARLYRRVARPWIVTRHVRRFCRPFSVDGREHLEGVRVRRSSSRITAVTSIPPSSSQSCRRRCTTEQRSSPLPIVSTRPR